MVKRSFLKILGFSIITFLSLPLNAVLSATKKIINNNLTKKQKEIMFNEGTERPFTSDLLNNTKFMENGKT